MGYRKISVSAKISGQNQYADGADGSSIIIQPDRKNNDSEEKEKQGFMGGPE